MKKTYKNLNTIIYFNCLYIGYSPAGACWHEFGPWVLYNGCIVCVKTLHITYRSFLLDLFDAHFVSFSTFFQFSLDFLLQLLHISELSGIQGLSSFLTIDFLLPERISFIIRKELFVSIILITSVCAYWIFYSQYRLCKMLFYTTYLYKFQVDWLSCSGDPAIFENVRFLKIELKTSGIHKFLLVL